jgi:hypothetical protein
MAKVKLTSLYVRDKDGQESSVNIAESKEGLTSAVAGLQNKVQLIDAKLKNSKGKQTIAHSIGEIIKSKTPIDSFGFKELKGEYISEYSDYTDFYRYIEKLYNASEDDIRYKIVKNFREYSNDTTRNKHNSHVDENGDYVYTPTHRTSIEVHQYRNHLKFNNTFELHFDFTTGTNVTTQQQILATVSSENHALFGNAIYARIQDSKLKFWIRSNLEGTVNYNIANNKNTTSSIHANSHYHVKLKFDGTQYSLWMSENDADYTHEWTINSTLKASNGDGRMISEIGGNGWGANPFLGTLHLSEFYFIADDKETWRAFEKKEIHSKKGFLTEEEYNDCLALSGQCNGLVFDNENRRVRLPTLAVRDLVESKQPTESDPYWFNLYSDGWLEQGSEFAYTHTDEYSSYELKFPISFKDYNYTLNFGYSTRTNDSNTARLCRSQVREKFKDQAMIRFENASTDFKINWDAHGYSDRHVNQSYYYYICIANGVDHLVVDKVTQSQLNIPFTLLEEKISYFKLNNSSWLLSEGQFNSGNTYKSVYNFLLEALNSEESEISVKDVNAEYDDYDFVIDTIKREFRLPKKSKQVDSQVDFLNSVKQSATDNARFIVEKKDPTDSDSSWYILYNDGWCEQGGKLTGQTEWIDLILLKPYKNADYHLQGQAMDDTGDHATVHVSFANKTSSGAKAICTYSSTSYAYPFTWVAQGYTDQTTESTLEIGEYQSPLHLYYYVGETNINYGLVDVGHLTEEVTNARSELNYYSKLLNEIEKKSDQYSYDLAVKNNTKALVNVDYSKLYSEHMNKLFAMPDPDNTGTIIKLRTNVTKENIRALWQDGGIVLNNSYTNTLQTANAKTQGAGSYSPMTLIDEFGRTLYLMRIAYARDYVESSYGANIHYLGNCHRAHLTNRNSDGNYTFDLYFTYDKSKANYGSVVALNEDQIPSYDVKGKMYCDIAQFDGRVSSGLHVCAYNWYGAYQNADDSSYDESRIYIEIPGFNRGLGAVQNLFNTISSGAWAYALNNVTITFLNTRIKKCSFGVIRDFRIWQVPTSSMRRSTYNGGVYDWYGPQVSNYDFSIETKYGVISKHYDQTQFTDTQNFKVVLDLSEATNKARNLESRVAEYNEVLAVKNTLNTKIDNSVQTINNTINTKYNDLSSQIQTVQTNLNTTNSNLQTQITNNKTDVNTKYAELKDLYTKTTKVKVISKEIEEQLELGTEKYDEDTLYLVDPTYDNEKAVWDAKQAVLTDQYNRAIN